MNNKGVTLIELLIVIVVIGIISAFAVPAVGQFLDNAEKSAVLQDAIAIRNGAENYCATEGCTDTQALTWTMLGDYVASFTASDYEECNGTSSVAIATRQSGGGWVVELEAAGATGEWEWSGQTVDPIDGSTSNVTADATS